MPLEVSPGTANNQGGEKKTRLELPLGHRALGRRKKTLVRYMRDPADDDGFDMATPKEEDPSHLLGVPSPHPASARLPTSDAFNNKVPWDTVVRSIVVTVLCSTCQLMTGNLIQGHDKIKHEADIDGNIKTFTEVDIERITRNFSTLIGNGGFGTVYRGFLDDDNEPVAVKKYMNEDLREVFMEEVRIHSKMRRENVVKLMGCCKKEFSAKRGIESSIVSHMTRRPRYLSVHHHPFIQILPSARKWITSKRTFGDIFKGGISAKPKYESFGDIFKGWISEKPKYETPIVGPVSEYIIRKLFGISNGLTVNRSQHHSDPDSCRSGHSKMAVNTKTSASWILATAAPHHATGNRNLLSGFITEHDGLFVHAVNQVPMKVLARGAVVTDALILPDVWFVPGLTENLVSVSQLAELDHSIGFGRGECCISSARDARIVGKGRLQKGGHYVLDYLKVPLAV